MSGIIRTPCEWFCAAVLALVVAWIAIVAVMAALPRRPASVPIKPVEIAECRWLEIEQPGQWEATCDPDAKPKWIKR